MTRLSFPRIVIYLCIVVGIAGCGKSPPAEPPVATEVPTISKAPGISEAPVLIPTSTATVGEPPVTKAALAISPTVAIAAEKAPFPDAAFLTDDIVGLAVTHPRRIMEQPVVQMLKQAGLTVGVEEQSGLSVKPESIERITLVVDQASVDELARSGGLQVVSLEPTIKKTTQAPVNLEPPVRSEPRPLMILTFVTVDQTAFIEGFLGESTEESFESQSLHKNEFNAVCFVDGMTAVCGPIESVRKLVTTHASGQPGSPEILQQLETGADFSFVLDIKSQASLLEQVIERIPELGIIQHLELVSFQFNLSGKSGATLLQLVARTANEDSAGMLSQFARVGLLQAQKTLTSMRLPAETADRQAAELARTVAQSATIDQAGTRIELRIPVPDGIEKLPEFLQPSIDSAAQSAARLQQTNRLRKIALGFHSYHDAHQKFPGAGQSADGKSGLSWRVHILPYVDEAALYNEFNLSEPWDSETNKKLIEKMPKIYEVKGVAAGKTSLHVFTGTGAPFANDQLPEFADFTDGLSNSLLVVQAASDTAEIWTKPGGLDFDPKNPVQSLGKQLENEFLGVIADGSVRVISKAISANNLRRLIQFQDGEVLE